MCARGFPAIPESNKEPKSDVPPELHQLVRDLPLPVVDALADEGSELLAEALDGEVRLPFQRERPGVALALPHVLAQLVILGMPFFANVLRLL